jgi:hypothetical protein
VLIAIVLPFLDIKEALLIRFKKYKHIAQERARSKAIVHLATRVRVSCKRIRNVLKAIVTLTCLEVKHL